MYRIELSKYNGKMNKIMDEQTTLEVHLSSEFSQDVPKEFLTYTPHEWAKYAFENGADYSINYYKNDKPYCEVRIYGMSIAISYYNDNNLSKSTLMVVFSKGSFVNGKFQMFNTNKIFLKQITWYSELSKTMLFYSNKKKNNILLEEWVIENGKTMLIEQFGTGDLSKHWFEGPKHYLDYEYLLDYQKLFDELPELK